MASYEYNEEDLPEIEVGEPRTLHDGAEATLIRVGHWSMEYINPYLEEDGDSILEDVEKTILSWIAYRNWLEKNPPNKMEESDD